MCGFNVAGSGYGGVGCVCGWIVVVFYFLCGCIMVVLDRCGVVCAGC